MSAASEETLYFRAIEETFIRLRGAPFLLSPEDWRVARRWRRAGVPVEQVCRSLERFFDQRRQRGKTDKVQSLRYCAAAVEADWRELSELAAPGRRGEGQRLPIDERLDRLAAALPEGEAATSLVAAALAELARSKPTAAPQVEVSLQRLEEEMLTALDASLAEAVRRELEAAVEASLTPLRQRLSAKAYEEARRRLWRETLRRRFSLPVLSLFSPEARGEAAE